jgi:chorismate synthase
MAGNTLGQIFRLTTFGESHGPAVGCIVDGCPAGLALDEAVVQRDLDRRRVGQSRVTSARQEADQVQILSGVFEGCTTGTPIAMLVHNTNARSQDYDGFKELYRPGHADFTWDAKYGFRDHRGGGRSSARETIGRVAGGAVAKQLLATVGVRIIAWTQQMDDLAAEVVDEEEIERNVMRCPDPRVAALMVTRVEEAKRSRDSLGGVVEVRARGVPAGLGEPVFDKLQADIGKAMFSIPAIKAVEFGEGRGAAHMRGSTHNDPFVRRTDGSIGTATNHHGGILGGISTGEEIRLRITVKPLASIAQPQQTVDKAGNPAEIVVTGRHDPTALPRLVPIAEAMLALVLADHWLRQRLARV